MVKNGAKTANSSAKAIKKILITQPKPETEKSPYFELAKRHNIELDFHPFISLRVSLRKNFESKKSIFHNTRLLFSRAAMLLIISFVHARK